MGIPVVSGASISCTSGMSPGQLMVTSQINVRFDGALVATISDSATMVNVGSCGMCTSLANPIVASATASALGVLTPMPCIPSPMGVWICMGTPMISSSPGLANDASLVCAYGGSIRIVSPGQTKVQY